MKPRFNLSHHEAPFNAGLHFSVAWRSPSSPLILGDLEYLFLTKIRLLIIFELMWRQKCFVVEYSFVVSKVEVSPRWKLALTCLLDVYANSTAVNVPYDTNWIQNTEGFDAINACNIRLTDMAYYGNDDCRTIKYKSCNIYVQNGRICSQWRTSTKWPLDYTSQ